MPYTLKPNKIFAKDPNGDGYFPQNVVTDQSTTEQVALINSTGAAQVSAIQAKGTQTLDSIPDDYTALQGEVDDLKSALTHIGVEQLALDCYPLDNLPGVTIYKNKSCGSYDATNKKPSAYTDKAGQDIVEFNIRDLINSGVTSISFPVPSSVGGVGQAVIIWTEGVVVSNVWGTNVDGVKTIPLNTVADSYTNCMITFVHGHQWMKYTKDYSEDAVERGVTGWLRKEDLPDGELDGLIAEKVQSTEILSNQIETEVRTYETSADKVAEIHPSTQIVGSGAGTIVELRTVANPRLLTSVYDVNKVSSITFIPNTSGNQWGAVIVLVKSNYMYISQVALPYIETPSRSWVTFDSTTRTATMDVSGMLNDFPDTEIILICSDANKGNPTVIAKNTMHISEFEWLDTSEKTTVEPIDFILPSKVPAVVGLPVWCYYENIYGDGYIEDDGITVLTSNYGIRRDAYKRTPAVAENVTITLNGYRNKELASVATFKIQAVDKSAGGSKSIKVLCIGDSKTEATGKRVRVNELVATDSYLDLEFIGTHGVAPTLSEGYSGRNIIEVCKNATLGSFTNIFYDNTLSTDIKFNFAKGVATIGHAPDIVFIDHGANQYYQKWADVLECYEAIITSIHSYDANIKIVICIQEAEGLALTTGQLKGSKIGYGYINPIADAYSIPKMLEAFENREDENVFICPQYMCVDLYNDYPLAMLPVSEDNSMKMLYCLDSVHPGTNNGNWSANTNYALYAYVRRNGLPYAACKESVGVDPATDDGTYWSPILNPEAGYRKIGDMYYAVIKYILSLT